MTRAPRSAPARLFAACAGLAAALILSGCGFQPLYATDTQVAPALARIRVETEEGRTDYMLGTALRDRLGTWGSSGSDYILRTRVDLSRTGQALRLDQVATRILLVTNVSYGLYDNRDGRLLTQGTVTGVATYDVPAEPYAAIRAEQDSEARATQEAADRVTIELANYFREANEGADTARAAPDAEPGA